MRNLIILGCAALLAFGLSLGAFAGSLVDADSDGVPDGVDNCVNDVNGPLLASACGVQYDADADGYGQDCDADLNNNNVVDLPDISALLAVFGTPNAVADLNCNNVVDLPDVSLLLGAFGAPPGPSGLPCAGSPGCTN